MMEKKQHAIKISREMFDDEKMKEKHRLKEVYFTRDRVLRFGIVLVLILKKGLKSIQVMLNEFFSELSLPTVSNVAFCKARRKLSHSAFIELNEKAIINVTYRENTYRTFKGYRLLAVDGSKIVLPDTPEIKEEFGIIPFTNGSTKEIGGERPYAMASIMYDVLNHISVHATLEKARAYEVDIAIQHIERATAKDIIIFDRGYASYRMLAELTRRKINFLIRCSKGSFKVAQEMNEGLGKESRTVNLLVPKQQRSEIRNKELPEMVRVRFVRVKLDTGENEILVTNLLQETDFPTQDFKQLYWHRWGVETFYGVLKTRLNLENFTGFSVESVKQDFYSTIYLTGLEAILIEKAEKILDQKPSENPQKVNKVISFNTIKNQAFEILCGEGKEEEIIEKLTTLFLTNPTLKRIHRKLPPRQKKNSRSLLNFQKYKRKIVF